MIRGVVLLAATVLLSCGHRGPSHILLFTGTGTSSGDVAAMESLLDEMHLDFDTASSSRLNGMFASDLRRYRLLIVPGGNFIHMGESLNAATSGNIRERSAKRLELFGNLRGRDSCRRKLQSDRRTIPVLLRRRSRHPKGGRRHHRCGWDHARSILGGRPSAFGLGRGRREISGWHACGRAGPGGIGMGSAHRNTS